MYVFMQWSVDKTFCLKVWISVHVKDFLHSKFVTEGKAGIITLIMAMFYLCVSILHERVIEGLHET